MKIEKNGEKIGKKRRWRDIRMMTILTANWVDHNHY